MDVHGILTKTPCMWNLKEVGCATICEDIYFLLYQGAITHIICEYFNSKTNKCKARYKPTGKENCYFTQGQIKGEEK